MMSKHPQISIAICTFNRADYLKDTLNDLSEQTAATVRFEIIVINNNSSDHTDEVCSEFKEMHPEINFRWVTETEQGLSPARNRAYKEAAADYILYIDDDVHLPQNFTETALQYLSDLPNIKAAGGRIFVSFDESEPDWIPHQLMPMFGLHDLGDSDKIYPRDNFPRGGNMLIHKEVFEKTGLFDPKLGRTGKSLIGSEEKAFFDRVRKAGIELHYLSELQLQHRIGPNRLERDYLKNQSIGIGSSERRRLDGQPARVFGKWCSEMVKLSGSLLLATGHLFRGKLKAAKFILIFRIWVLKGFSGRG
ncbi:glycosyltransferase family 2 protein [Rhodohalobacter sp. SW132]|uniref:glycosyltransferase n=1 Tax=Rhodohalobacter sp. SW132 TaxID=2293433 RepID=UPI000E2597C0|nr:glycosyltransferase [Rhodohalobacter sp. SW132]REL24880.1 glycosyltransferase family 2 protein [Rhodohalobacter sp. SW132]